MVYREDRQVEVEVEGGGVDVVVRYGG